jgi:hypothetical protein
MRSTPSRILAGIVATVMVSGLVAVRAEVSVRTDRDGRYVTTQIDVDKGTPRESGSVWSHRGLAGRDSDVLNPDGDRNGDLWPVVIESPRPPFHPWAVWSRFEGSGYRLVWSVWTPDGWQQASPVSLKGLGNDLDPDLAFDREGRPVVVWTHEEGESTLVLMSVFHKKGFMPPVLVSRVTENGQYPEIVSASREAVQVEYVTSAGTVQRTISFSEPGTITDDINPLGYDADDGSIPIFTGSTNAPGIPASRDQRPRR